MKIGISLGMLRPSLWVEATREADRLGFESVWIPEHLVIPVDVTGSPRHGDDHPPVGQAFNTRGRRVDETIGVCQRLWSEEVIEHHGEFFDFGPVMFEPKRVHAPWPPLHIGGDGPAALRRAATVGDGWFPMNHQLEEIPAAAKRIAQIREDAGRPGSVEITLGAGPSDLDSLRRHADFGVGRTMVKPWQSTKDAIESIRRFADTVLHQVSDYPVTTPDGAD